MATERTKSVLPPSVYMRSCMTVHDSKLREVFRDCHSQTWGPGGEYPALGSFLTNDHHVPRCLFLPNRSFIEREGSLTLVGDRRAAGLDLPSSPPPSHLNPTSPMGLRLFAG